MYHMLLGGETLLYYSLYLKYLVQVARRFEEILLPDMRAIPVLCFCWWIAKPGASMCLQVNVIGSITDTLLAPPEKRKNYLIKVPPHVQNPLIQPIHVTAQSVKNTEEPLGVHTAQVQLAIHPPPHVPVRIPRTRRWRTYVG